jgi:hypothetical protein
VSILVSASQVADLAPASLAAVSILFLHIPQLPDTLNVSVFSCAVAAVTKNNEHNAIENIFSDFMIDEF